MIPIYIVYKNKNYVACITESEKKALELIEEFPCEKCDKIHTCVICNQIKGWLDMLADAYSGDYSIA